MAKSQQKTPPFKVPAELGGVSTLKDGSLSMRFQTQELSVAEKVGVMEYVQKFGWLIFSPVEITGEDIPTKDPEIEGKTPGQRLRTLLYILWKQKSQEPDFESYYRRQMEKIIGSVKERLDQ